MRKIQMRPHHALCAQLFAGKGYNDRFVQHMRCVLSELDHKDPPVTLTNECDLICAECPNRKNGVCISDDKVKEIDRRAVQKMGLDHGDSVRWSKLCEAAVQTVIRPGLLRDVCGNCEWIGFCAGKGC